MTKIKRLTIRWILGLVSLLAIVNAVIAANIRQSGAAKLWFPVVFSIGIGGIAVLEGWNKQYLSTSTYRSISTPQIIGIISLIVGGLAIASGIAIAPLAITASIPAAAITFLGTFAATISVLVAIVAFIQIFVV